LTLACIASRPESEKRILYLVDFSNNYSYGSQSKAMHLKDLKPRVAWTLIVTDCQAKHFAYELPCRFPPDSVEHAILVDGNVR
jgi:hypothetical protein